MTKTARGYRGLPLEGYLARWYARLTRKNLADYENAAAEIAAQLAPAASVLEVAPGPGYLAIALAKTGDYRVAGLDISKSFVEMATANARAVGVDVAFHHGDAAAMPFSADAFDFLVCRAAFKNFSAPEQALAEMHRVLKPGGTALIVDLRADASIEDINDHVRSMRLGVVNRVVTRLTFKHMLLKRAYSKAQFTEFAAQSPFGKCAIAEDSIGFKITLTK